MYMFFFFIKDTTGDPSEPEPVVSYIARTEMKRNGVYLTLNANVSDIANNMLKLYVGISDQQCVFLKLTSLNLTKQIKLQYVFKC